MRTCRPIFIIPTLLSLSLAASLNKSPELRIVGGENVTIDQFPYQVAILVNGVLNCGGTIINDLYILTAAHCLTRFTVESLSVRAGSSFYYEGGTVRQVAQVFIHPDYNAPTHNNDIALMKLQESLTFNENIAPAELPVENKRNNSVDNLNGAATGWGRLYDKGPAANQLQMVILPTLKQSICELVYTTSKINDRMFCAGYYKGGKDTCQGDSGGPLATNGLVFGVTSWGDGCGEMNSPGVYTRVSYFIDYINSIISN